ncbi:MAG TPA: histidine phosphatase family protein [Streptosporangiaceae bacterium]|nr:histidine phosphatase family protein [Streptosporangiaceae bacterium]
MSKRLIVLRHAKATHKPGFPDVDRPLTSRGERDADAAGQWLHARQIVPDLVLCSTSRRTRETWDRVALALAGNSGGTGVDVRYDSRLYQADAGETLEIIAGDAGDEQTLLLVGHNPAAQQIVSRLTARNDLELPTSALAVIGLGDWDNLARGAGTLQSVWTPKAEHG